MCGQQLGLRVQLARLRGRPCQHWLFLGRPCIQGLAQPSAQGPVPTPLGRAAAPSSRSASCSMRFTRQHLHTGICRVLLHWQHVLLRAAWCGCSKAWRFRKGLHAISTAHLARDQPAGWAAGGSRLDAVPDRACPANSRCWAMLCAQLSRADLGRTKKPTSSVRADVSHRVRMTCQTTWTARHGRAWCSGAVCLDLLMVQDLC